MMELTEQAGSSAYLLRYASKKLQQIEQVDQYYSFFSKTL
jgi:hypothetical protein